MSCERVFVVNIGVNAQFVESVRYDASSIRKKEPLRQSAAVHFDSLVRRRHAFVEPMVVRRNNAFGGVVTSQGNIVARAKQLNAAKVL